jgi:hypothetical protein
MRRGTEMNLVCFCCGLGGDAEGITADHHHRQQNYSITKGITLTGCRSMTVGLANTIKVRRKGKEKIRTLNFSKEM